MSDRNRVVSRRFHGGSARPGARRHAHEWLHQSRVQRPLRVSGGRPTLRSPFRRRLWEGQRQGLRRDSIACSEPPRSRSPAPCWRSPPPRAASRRAPAVTPTRRRSCRPARAVYAQAAVQPTGDRREDALAAAGKLLRTDDPAGKLRAEIDKALAEEGDGFTWEKDFAPWLGEDAGMWATNLEADEPDFAVIVATKDAEAAKAALERFKQADEDTGPYTKQSHDGVDYEVDAEDTADRHRRRLPGHRHRGRLQAHGRHATRAATASPTPTATRTRSTTSRTTASATTSSTSGRSSTPRPRRIPEAAKQLEQFKSFLPVDKLGPITGSFQADGDGMSLDTVLTGLPEGPFRDLAALWSGGESELLGGAARRRVGRVRDAQARRVRQDAVRLVRRRDRRGGDHRAGPAGDRARPGAGRVLLGRRRRRVRARDHRRPTSTARSSSPPRTTRRRPPRSASSSG